jgi:hypothetical protein
LVFEDSMFLHGPRRSSRLRINLIDRVFLSAGDFSKD